MRMLIASGSFREVCIEATKVNDDFALQSDLQQKAKERSTYMVWTSLLILDVVSNGFGSPHSGTPDLRCPLYFVLDRSAGLEFPEYMPVEAFLVLLRQGQQEHDKQSH
jgi:hypothetical protein